MALSKLPLYSVFFFLYISLFISSQALSSKIAVAQIKDQQDNEPFVGINIGEDVSNLMSATELVSFLQFQKLLAIGSSNTTAASWIGKNVVAYYPQTVITAIAVGDEVLTTVPSSAPLLMPAIEHGVGYVPGKANCRNSARGRIAISLTCQDLHGLLLHLENSYYQKAYGSCKFPGSQRDGKCKQKSNYLLKTTCNNFSPNFPTSDASKKITKKARTVVNTTNSKYRTVVKITSASKGSRMRQ
ncbi:hypothetical protein D5086_007791 [Populus alba]|uniref:Uncharacterized protein n=1 Tax=Populus alba TaxID=43335 RepID=A0ACC4CF31_POPAL